MYMEQQKTATKIHIRFKVKAETEFEDQLFISGSLTQLGKWNIDSAHKLFTSSDLYPFWSSQEQLNVDHSCDIQFKCLRINKNQEVIWQPITVNRKLKVQNQQLIIMLQFGKDSFTILKQICVDHNQFDNQSYSFKGIQSFTFLSSNDKFLNVHVFDWINNIKLQFKQYNVKSQKDFICNQFHNTKRLFYIKDQQVLSMITKYHNHSINICFDQRQCQNIKLKQIQKCKVILCDSTDFMKKYQQHVMMIGFKTFVNRGSLLVINNYGLQIVTISKYNFQFQKMRSQLNQDSLELQCLKIFNVIFHSHRFLNTKINLQPDKKLSRSSIIIVGYLEFIHIIETKRTMLQKYLNQNKSYILLSKLSISQFQEGSKCLSKRPNIVSLTDFSIVQDNKIHSFYSQSTNHLQQLKQRFLAQKILTLVYDSPFAIILQHNVPRLFETHKQLFQKQQSRFNKLQFKFSNNRIQIQVMRMVDILTKIIQNTNCTQVVLCGTQALFWDIDTFQFPNHEIRRILSLCQLQKLINI